MNCNVQLLVCYTPTHARCTAVMAGDCPHGHAGNCGECMKDDVGSARPPGTADPAGSGKRVPGVTANAAGTGATPPRNNVPVVDVETVAARVAAATKKARLLKRGVSGSPPAGLGERAAGDGRLDGRRWWGGDRHGSDRTAGDDGAHDGDGDGDIWRAAMETNALPKVPPLRDRTYDSRGGDGQHHHQHHHHHDHHHLRRRQHHDQHRPPPSLPGDSDRSASPRFPPPRTVVVHGSVHRDRHTGPLARLDGVAVSPHEAPPHLGRPSGQPDPSRIDSARRASEDAATALLAAAHSAVETDGAASRQAWDGDLGLSPLHDGKHLAALMRDDSQTSAALVRSYVASPAEGVGPRAADARKPGDGDEPHGVKRGVSDGGRPAVRFPNAQECRACPCLVGGARVCVCDAFFRTRAGNSHPFSRSG